ncbi:ankyrin repeat domain-containing protein [Gimesia benthica]|uniref:Ankyrin repeat domain-containing protein n=2 Tax=Gimesia benthica TaxID=2608982 RepID=A0A6I6AAM8_9PLAN|nr:ankyrin repeat domain-containing protein [Gimesia benthica]
MHADCSNVVDPGNAADTGRGGASPLDRTPEGLTTLMLAALNNGQSQERLEYLLEQGVEINAVTEAGASAYSYANEKGHDTVRDYLLSRGAEVNDYISPWRRKKVEE